MNREQELRDFFSHDAFATDTTGIIIQSISDECVKTGLKIEAHHLNANGTVMGGCIYTLVDFTFAIASNVGGNSTSTLTANITYNSPAIGEYLYASSSIIKDGRRIATYMVTVTDEKERIIATATLMGYRA